MAFVFSTKRASWLYAPRGGEMLGDLSDQQSAPAVLAAIRVSLGRLAVTIARASHVEAAIVRRGVADVTASKPSASSHLPRPAIGWLGRCSRRLARTSAFRQITRVRSWRDPPGDADLWICSGGGAGNQALDSRMSGGMMPA